MSAVHFSASIVERREVGPRTFVLGLTGCEALGPAQPGQFVMLRGPWGRDPLLPRAFSILGLGPGGRAELLVKAVGRGTGLLSEVAVGTEVTILGPLGRAFPLPEPATEQGADALDVLVAGGVGLAPLLWYAEVCRDLGRRTALVYGARSADELVLLDRIAGVGCDLKVTTEDGSRGLRGRVTDALAPLLAGLGAGAAARVLTCGPNPMMRAVADLARQHGRRCLVSVEGEMACGIGVCLGCAVPRAEGSTSARPYGYACVDGPVFDAKDIVIP